MSFRISTGPLRFLPVALLCIGFIVLYIRYCIQDMLDFNKAIDNLHISFDDFPLDYARALNDSVKQGKLIEYEHSHTSPPQIPRIVHRIWFPRATARVGEGSQVPEIWGDTQQSCEERSPGFTYYTWDQSSGYEFLKQNYPWFLETYEGYQYTIQRIDALKYFVLYHYGGVYIDMDMSCRRPLDPLLNFSAWFPRAQPYGVNNDLMATRPGHPIFRRFINNLRRQNVHYFFTYPTVYWSTGPMFVDTVLVEWFRELRNTDTEEQLDEAKSRGRYTGPKDMAVLPLHFYSEEYTFFGHLPGGTWHGADVFVVVGIWENLWTFLGVSFIVAILLYTVTKKRGRRGVYRLLELATEQSRHVMKLPIYER